MSLLDMHRSQLQRERDAAAKDRKAIADASAKAVGKERELLRNPSASRQRSLLSDLQRLGTTRAAAEKSLAAHERNIVDLSKKIATEEAADQKKAAAAQSNQQKETERRVGSATTAVRRLEGRVSGIEDAFLAQVQADVQKDRVDRDHDVFLSHTSGARDIEVSTDLYAELTGRGLDVWYDGAELRLGESLMRQIDRGIARSKVGVILITEAFLNPDPPMQ